MAAGCVMDLASMTFKLVVQPSSTMRTPPEAMSWVTPSSEDDLAVERDFTSGGVEEDLAAGVA